MYWSTLFDRVGRKPILLVGLAGLSKTFLGVIMRQVTRLVRLSNWLQAELEADAWMVFWVIPVFVWLFEMIEMVTLVSSKGRFVNFWHMMFFMNFRFSVLVEITDETNIAQVSERQHRLVINLLLRVPVNCLHREHCMHMERFMMRASPNCFLSSAWPYHRRPIVTTCWTVSNPVQQQWRNTLTLPRALSRQPFLLWRGL